MKLDIRWPMGILFLIFGLLIGGYGLSVTQAHADSLNVDFLWGAVLTAFGAVMLWLARRSSRVNGRP